MGLMMPLMLGAPLAGDPTGAQHVAPDDTGSPTVVRMSKSTYQHVAHLLGPVLLLVDYESFVWLSLPPASVATLRRARADFTREPEATVLFLNRFRFDPLRGEPSLPPGQQTAYAHGQPGFYLIQLVGPTREAWLSRLRSAGVALIQFQPNHAYIVRMTPEQAVALRSHRFVRWVGIYHAAYRIAPSTLAPTEAQIIENVDITIYNDGQVPAAIAAISALGGRLVQQFPAQPDGSLVTAIFALPSSALERVAQLSTVLWVNFSSPRPELLDEVADQIVVGRTDDTGVPVTGYRDWLTRTGIDGSGVIVANVDTGVDSNDNDTAHPDLRGRIATFVGYPGQPATDEDGHGTHTAGIIAGNASLGTVDGKGFLLGLGVAPGARLVVQNPIGFSFWPPLGAWPQLSRDSVINGAVASNNSWSLGGLAGYSSAARTHDIMVRDADFTTPTVSEPLTMVFGAGNFGPSPKTIPEPQEAKNIITVGASENFRDDPWVTPGIGCGSPSDINAVWEGSSRGPAKDGRLLPNVMAPGTFVASLRSATGTYGPPKCLSAIDGDYAWDTGTSMAAPHVTGGVALITQWWGIRFGGRKPSPAMVKALLISGAVDMGAANIPNNDEGWGRVNLDNVINPQVLVLYRDQATIFRRSGATWSLRVVPDATFRPLKVTLVWTDAPGVGSGGDSKALVNDLDLTVTQFARTGVSVFRGNRGFAGGWSTPVGPGEEADRHNNVESVYLRDPAGVHLITVTAHNIGQDAIDMTPPSRATAPGQDFALVCVNCRGFLRDFPLPRSPFSP
jgi:hypothetical protein